MLQHVAAHANLLEVYCTTAACAHKHARLVFFFTQFH